MKVIELLNKIVNGEEVPKVIKKQWKYEWQYDEVREEYTYMQETGERFDDDWLVINMLNDEVEILEEEKKIPEKLIPTSLKGIDNLDEKIEIVHIDTVSVIETVNQVIDYLKSKGE